MFPRRCYVFITDLIRSGPSSFPRRHALRTLLRRCGGCGTAHGGHLTSGDCCCRGRGDDCGTTWGRRRRRWLWKFSGGECDENVSDLELVGPEAVRVEGAVGVAWGPALAVHEVRVVKGWFKFHLEIKRKRVELKASDSDSKHKYSTKEQTIH